MSWVFTIIRVVHDFYFLYTLMLQQFLMVNSINITFSCNFVHEHASLSPYRMPTFWCFEGGFKKKVTKRNEKTNCGETWDSFLAIAHHYANIGKLVTFSCVWHLKPHANPTNIQYLN